MSVVVESSAPARGTVLTQAARPVAVGVRAVWTALVRFLRGDGLSGCRLPVVGFREMGDGEVGDVPSVEGCATALVLPQVDPDECCSGGGVCHRVALLVTARVIVGGCEVGGHWAARRRRVRVQAIQDRVRVMARTAMTVVRRLAEVAFRG